MSTPTDSSADSDFSDRSVEIWRMYYPRAVVYARRRLNGLPAEVDAEDVASAALLTVCRQHDSQLEIENRLWSFIIVVAKRRILDYHRKVESRKRCLSRYVCDERFAEVSGEPDPAAVVDSQDLKQHLLNSLEKPLLCDIAVERIDGATITEIADSHSISRTTVARHIRRIQHCLLSIVDRDEPLERGVVWSRRASAK